MEAPDDSHPGTARSAHWVNHLVLYAVVLLVMYVLSSGPIIGLACLLREWTGIDAFYAVFWVYFPLLAIGSDTILFTYIEWWVVDVFQTVGPG